MNTHLQTDGREPEASALKDNLLDIHEQCLLAQLAAVRRMRGDSSPSQAKTRSEPDRKRGRSQVDLAEYILKTAGTPLHVSEIISRIALASGRQVDAESLVSALSKRVARNDRFRRTARNTFALL